MENIFIGLLNILNTETADINQYVWESYQGKVTLENIEIIESENQMRFDVSVNLYDGWKGYYPNEQNGGNELKIDVIELEDETVTLDFPDPEILYYFDESFVGYGSDYVVSGVIEGLEPEMDTQTLRFNISFCSNLCVPEEFEFVIN